MEESIISATLTIDPSDLLIVNIKGIYGELDFVAYKTKFRDVFPIVDINSTVSIRGSLITLIQRYSKPLNKAVKTDFVAPDTLSSVVVVVPEI
jgi:hypothetical protein